MEAALRQSQKLESIGTLASGVAHEINNPLMGMMNYAELVKDTTRDAKAIEYLSEIEHEGNRIATIVRNLLSFARQDKEEHSPARIADIISDSLSLVGSTLRKDQIALELDIPDGLPQVKCRSQQIQQVIINLLANAHDALIARYPEYDENKLIRVTARSFERDGEDWIRTTIEDHGAGVSEDKVQRIFDPFFTTKPRHKGTGLGLSVSYGIVKEHHGELSVESKHDEYTRFHIDLRVNNGWRHEPSQAVNV
jgi:signal transduction histidine kinase